MRKTFVRGHPEEARRGDLSAEAVVGAYASAARQHTVRLPLDPDDAVYQRGLEALLEREAPVAV